VRWNWEILMYWMMKWIDAREIFKWEALHSRLGFRRKERKERVSNDDND
jgi:hypothetical protein